MYRMLKLIAVWSLSHCAVLVLAVGCLSTAPLEAQGLCRGGKVIWRGGGMVGCVFTKLGDEEKAICGSQTILTPTQHTGTCWVCIEDQLVSVINNPQRWGEVTVGVNESGAPKGDFTCLSGVRPFEQVPECIEPPRGVSGWWTFDEDSGEFARDRVVGNHGKYSDMTKNGGPAPSGAKVGNGLYFHSSQKNYVDIPDHPVLRGNNWNLSFDFWMAAPEANGVVVILDKRIAQSPYTGYHLFLYNGVLGLQLADTKGYTNYSSDVKVADNKLHFVAVTVQRRSKDGIRWYVDGAEVGVRRDPTGRSGSLGNNVDLRVGAKSVSPPIGFFEGTIDELEIFRRVLGPGEIKAIFDADRLGKCKK